MSEDAALGPAHVFLDEHDQPVETEAPAPAAMDSAAGTLKSREAILLDDFRATARRLKAAEEELRAAQLAHAESIKALSKEVAG